MRIARIDQAITICDDHLEKSGAKGTEIESFLTQYLCVVMCAAFEEAIKAMVVERAAQHGDQELKSFVESAAGIVFRSPKTEEITGLLRRFGTDCRGRFREELDRNLKAETFFNNIIVNRHETAHSSGSNLSFADLVNFYSEGHVVLDAVKLALMQPGSGNQP